MAPVRQSQRLIEHACASPALTSASAQRELGKDAQLRPYLAQNALLSPDVAVELAGARGTTAATAAALLGRILPESARHAVLTMPKVPKSALASMLKVNAGQLTVDEVRQAEERSPGVTAAISSLLTGVTRTTSASACGGMSRLEALAEGLYSADEEKDALRTASQWFTDKRKSAKAPSLFATVLSRHPDVIPDVTSTSVYPLLLAVAGSRFLSRWDDVEAVMTTAGPDGAFVLSALAYNPALSRDTLSKMRQVVPDTWGMTSVRQDLDKVLARPVEPVPPDWQDIEDISILTRLANRTMPNQFRQAGRLWNLDVLLQAPGWDNDPAAAAQVAFRVKAYVSEFPEPQLEMLLAWLDRLLALPQMDGVSRSSVIATQEAAKVWNKNQSRKHKPYVAPVSCQVRHEQLAKILDAPPEQWSWHEVVVKFLDASGNPVPDDQVRYGSTRPAESVPRSVSALGFAVVTELQQDPRALRNADALTQREFPGTLNELFDAVRMLG